MGKLKSLVSAIFSNVWARSIVFLLVGYLTSLLVHPHQAGNLIHSGMKKGCNVVFQYNICTAVGLKHSNLAQVYKEERKNFNTHQVVQKKAIIRKPTPQPIKKVVTNKAPVIIEKEPIKKTQNVVNSSPKEPRKFLPSRVSSTPVSLDVR